MITVHLDMQCHHVYCMTFIDYCLQIHCGMGSIFTFLLNSTSQEGNSQDESLFQNQYFLFECILPRTGTVDSIIIFQSCFVFNGF